MSNLVRAPPDVGRTPVIPAALHRGSRRGRPNIAAVRSTAGEYLRKKKKKIQK